MSEPVVRDAMILAAGRGERLRPLTDYTPKPLIEVRGKPLIGWHLEALARAGIERVVVNTAWLEQRIVDELGDGRRWGLSIRWSLEGRDHGGALETAGGIAKALPLLPDCFWVVSADIFIPGFPFDTDDARRFVAGPLLAHLWLAPNPSHHPRGDFGIAEDGLATLDERCTRRTWASIGLFRAEMFRGIAPGTRMPLRPLLEQAIRDRRLGAKPWDGTWTDVGTAERLELARQG